MLINFSLHLIEVFASLIFILIALQVLYYGVFAVAAHFYKPKLLSQHDNEGAPRSLAVLIPVYAEDQLIINTAFQALQQSYNASSFRVIVLADQLKESTIAQLEHMSIEVVRVQFENSTKAKSINAGLEYLKSEPVDAVVILDADNVMSYDFLSLVDKGLKQGYPIIQGHRTAKNQNTTVALLDAINEEIGNSIYRRGHQTLGLSSGLIGSGIAFDYDKLRMIMPAISDVAGEDKMLEIMSFELGLEILYLDEALVFDEKVSSGDHFTQQRTRWVAAQLHMFKIYGIERWSKLFSNNLDYLDKVLQFGLIPKVILLAILGLCSIVSLAGVLPLYWLILLPVYCLALLLAVPKAFYNRRLRRAIMGIPASIFFMCRAMLKIRKSTASTFKVTPKGVTVDSART